MIVDELENSAVYEKVLPGLAAAFRFLVDNARADLPEGDYEIDGRNVYAVVLHRVTTPIEGAQFETHDRYADLHCVMSGRETIGWAPRKCLRAHSEHDPKGDVTFYDLPPDPTLVKMDPGRFALFLPDDGHMPLKQREKPSEVYKIVVKVRVEKAMGKQ